MRSLNDFLRWIAVVAVVAFVVIPVQAQNFERQAESLGLQVMWHSHLAQTTMNRPPISVILHPHTTKRHQLVSVRLDGRLLEQFDGNAIDRVQWEKRLAEAHVQAGANVDVAVPRLGLEGAKSEAQKVVDRLAKLKKVATIDPPIDLQVIQMLVTCADGTLQLMDAETGDVHWTKVIGTPSLPTLPASLGDELVSAINGANLFIIRTSDGMILDKRAVRDPAGGGSVVLGDMKSAGRVFLTNLDGSLAAYDLLKKFNYPWYARSGGYGYLPPVLSLDEKFVAWISAPHYVNIVRIDEQLQSWNRFETTDRIAGNPTPIQDGFLVTTTAGTVVRLSLSFSDRDVDRRSDSVLWRFNTGEPIGKSAYAGGNTVFVCKLNGQLIGLDHLTGLPKWKQPVNGIDTIVATTEKKVYAKTRDGRLLLIDSETGQEMRSMPLPAGYFMSNYVNDRIYFFGDDGKLIALRDRETVLPNFHLETEKKPTKEKKSQPSRNTGNFDEEPSSSDPFGASPFDIDASSKDDVFSSPADDSDPFGG